MIKDYTRLPSKDNLTFSESSVEDGELLLREKFYLG
jgi:hypothetical protein